MNWSFSLEQLDTFTNGQFSDQILKARSNTIRVRISIKSSPSQTLWASDHISMSVYIVLEVNLTEEEAHTIQVAAISLGFKGHRCVDNNGQTLLMTLERLVI